MILREVTVRDAPRAEFRVDVLVEGYSTLLNQMKRAERGNWFADRGGLKQRLRRNWLRVAFVAKAVALLAKQSCRRRLRLEQALECGALSFAR